MLFILESIYKKTLYFLANRLMRDVVSQVWRDAYTAGFREGMEEGTDSIVNEWDDFTSGYELGYKDAMGNEPDVRTQEQYASFRGHRQA